MATPTQLRAVSYWALAYRRTWRGSIVSTFLTPVLYLLAMGVGLGSFVDKGGHQAALGHLSYLKYVAPGLAAATAAMTGTGEASFPVMGAIKWTKTYYAMLATPLGVGDVLVAHLVWIAARVAMATTGYLIVMAAFGATPSLETVAVLPAGVLVGMAFATPLAAYSATQENDGSLSLVYRLGMIPLFLFSGIFFPVSQLPEGVRVLAYATPLWHGVELTRALTLGRVSAGAAVGHVAYLAALTALGVVAAKRVFTRKLRT
jgi:lipooligosaccharide transport system permease protein